MNSFQSRVHRLEKGLFSNPKFPLIAIRFEKFGEWPPIPMNTPENAVIVYLPKKKQIGEPVSY